jgi:hypothetical protein
MIYLALRTTIWLRFDETSQEELAAYSLPGSCFRLTETPVLASQPVYAGDIIDARLLPDGSHRFVRVLVPAPFNHYTWLLSPNVATSQQLKAFIEALESNGGDWEQVFGGLLHVHTPIASTFDVEVEMDRVLEAVRITPPNNPCRRPKGKRRLAHLKYL